MQSKTPTSRLATALGPCETNNIRGRTATVNCVQRRGVNFNNLISVHTTRITTVGRNQSAVQTAPVGNGHVLKFAGVKAHSVRNKVADVVDLVVNSNIDICVITETWLKDCDSVTVAGLSPSGYSFENSSRKAARSRGGLGLMFKSMMRTKLVDAGSFEWNIT